MPLNFPDTPTVNQTYTSGGQTWQWNGTAWRLVPLTGPTGPTGPVNSISIGTVSSVGLYPSASPTVTVTGPAGSQTLSFGLVAGPTGPAGTSGITSSTSGPTGGSDGDVWFVYS